MPQIIHFHDVQRVDPARRRARLIIGADVQAAEASSRRYRQLIAERPHPLRWQPTPAERHVRALLRHFAELLGLLS